MKYNKKIRPSLATGDGLNIRYSINTSKRRSFTVLNFSKKVSKKQMWVEDLANGKYKYCERYTDTKGKIRKVSVTLDKNSSRARNEASRLLYNKIDAKLEKEKQKIEDEQNKIASITF